MPRLSQTLGFLQSPSFQQAQSVLIGQLTQSIVNGRTPFTTFLHHYSHNPSEIILIFWFSAQKTFIIMMLKTAEHNFFQVSLMNRNFRRKAKE